MKSYKKLEDKLVEVGQELLDRFDIDINDIIDIVKDRLNEIEKGKEK